MNRDFAYEAWSVLDQFAPHPQLEEQKRRIVNRTLERIEQATMIRDVEDLLRLRNAQPLAS